MSDIIKEIIKMLPADVISDTAFEAANIVLYTKDKEFLLDNKGIIKEAVHTFKKRIELRADPSIVLDQKKAETAIKKLMPKEAGVNNIRFDNARSIVVIEAEKPGLAIGKQGALLKEIRGKTFWIPLITRTPPIKSILIENIREVLFQHSEERKKFLDKVGHRIYDGWQRTKQHEWVRLTFLGSGRQVGRSCLFLQTPESRILLDCGIDVATEGPEAYPYLDAPEFDIKELDAVIVSHSHVDHSGFVPYLFKFGYRGPVYCTAPTRDVMSLLTLDTVKIMKTENKEPLYSTDDIKEMVKHTITLDFEEVSDITPDIRITMYNSGHILGSAMVHLHIGNGLHNFMYTGDIKYGKSLLLEPAHTQFPRLETMTLESTYGGQVNTLGPVKEQDDNLKKLIQETIARGGKVLMPVLGSGRAQDVMVMIEQMIRLKELAPIPIYIDGMVWDITAIHTAYPEYLNRNLRKLIFHKDQNPFMNDIFKRIGSQKERLQLVEDTGPCVILATSGMLVGGPSVEYLKHLADNPNNTLIFSCYQGVGSLGRRIKAGEKELIFKNGTKQEIVPIKMQIDKIEISDHSDRKQLMNFVFKCNPKPKKIIINHGEGTRPLDLASAIHKQARIETCAPKNLETLRLK
ncbi:beta-CASP ribonuclease aCPSF1 [Candidatus Woesearchaeota archaeon CG10_big_fil_rev_8_21_14_0_10_30_7]|nr:MAG: beta-CASP ribonuclease aCPSF1 [Candidatus Woesearchaeota archaeon CG10_big_fil_rev_8_21_14_0_10_30_7]